MRYKELLENSTIGSTSSGNIATVVKSNSSILRRNTLGVGFNYDGDYGIYKKNKKLNKKQKRG